MKNLFLALILMLTAGCSAVSDKVVQFVGNDLEVTSALAKKYGKPEVASCADFMITKVKEIQSGNSALEALRNEPTAGLFSAALKAALVADALKSLQASQGPEFEKQFKSACSAVAGDILFNIMQDAAVVAKRG